MIFPKWWSHSVNCKQNKQKKMCFTLLFYCCENYNFLIFISRSSKFCVQFSLQNVFYVSDLYRVRVFFSFLSFFFIYLTHILWQFNYQYTHTHIRATYVYSIFVLFVYVFLMTHHMRVTIVKFILSSKTLYCFVVYRKNFHIRNVW